LARDSLPGSIYFVGPDVSPDSLNETYLYYSPDTGKTLHIRRTYDGDYAMHNIAVTADASSGILYLTDDSHYGDLYFSNNFGETWVPRDFDAYSASSGCTTGQVAASSGHWSEDYGVSFSVGSGIGLPPSTRYYFSIGNLPGMLWAVCSDRNIYVTTDYSDTFDTLAPAPDYGPIRRGHADNEAFIFSLESGPGDFERIYFSENACTSFTDICEIELPDVDNPFYSHTAFERGWQQGQLLALYFDFYRISPPYADWEGGEIRIFISNDAGETWRLVSHHASNGDAIHDVPHIETKEIDKINVTETELSSESRIYLYDIRGRLIASGQTIYKNNLNNGFYIAKTKTDVKKILIFK
jgi:hypothetical protein